MVLTQWETARHESHFVFIASFAMLLFSVLLSLAHVPSIINFFVSFGAVYVVKRLWFVHEDEEERPGKTLIRALINSVYLGNIYVLAWFCGSLVAKSTSLLDVYELRNRKKITSDGWLLLYFNYYFCYYVLMLVFVNVTRFVENFFTSIGATIAVRM